MSWFVANALWLKAVHILSVIAWMVGMLYLPRLFVHHCSAEPGSPTSEIFKRMEHQLSRYVMTPAMLVALVIGLIMLFAKTNLLSGNGFMHVKLVLLVAMFALHGMMMKWLKDFAQDRNTKSEKFYRIASQVPAALLVAIVILIVVRPF